MPCPLHAHGQQPAIRGGSHRGGGEVAGEGATDEDGHTRPTAIPGAVAAEVGCEALVLVGGSSLLQPQMRLLLRDPSSHRAGPSLLQTHNMKASRDPGPIQGKDMLLAV
jgi:hypothetical protein